MLKLLNSRPSAGVVSSYENESKAPHGMIGTRCLIDPFRSSPPIGLSERVSVIVERKSLTNRTRICHFSYERLLCCRATALSGLCSTSLGINQHWPSTFREGEATPMLAHHDRPPAIEDVEYISPTLCGVLLAVPLTAIGFDASTGVRLGFRPLARCGHRWSRIKSCNGRNDLSAAAAAIQGHFTRFIRSATRILSAGSGSRLGASTAAELCCHYMPTTTTSAATTK